MSRGVLTLLLVTLLHVAGALASGTQRGVPLTDLLEGLREQGYEVIYSADLVRPDMLAAPSPGARGDLERAREALARHGLELVEVSPGVVVVRLGARPEGAPPPPWDRVGESLLLEEIVVTPDRFDLSGEGFEEREVFDGAELDSAPLRVGDTMSLVEALPGVALGGEQAAPRIRGSTERDVLVVVDGLEIYQPYHLPNFRAPVSLIDPATVDRFEVQTGGLSTEFGDRYGGLVRIETPTHPDEAQRGVMLGTTSSRLMWSEALGQGSALLLSARAWYPNAVDLTINVGDDEITPTMQDFLGKLVVPIGERHTLALHLLGSRDRIDYRAPEGDERVDAKARSGYAWARLRSSWSPRLASELVAGFGDLSRSRRGFSIGDAKEAARVDDLRDVSISTLSARATARRGERHLLSAGIDLRHVRAEYDYVSTIEQAAGVLTRRFDEIPSGASLGVFLNDRVRLGARVVLEYGLRADYQEYTDDRQLSPRANLAIRLAPRSILRFSAGRYAQSQRVYELEVEDGVESFSRAEISDQLSASWTAGTSSGWTSRIGAYARRLRRLRPRFENLFNPVELFPEVERDRVLIEADRGRAFGLELSLASPDDERWLYGHVAYTLSRAEDREAGRWIARSWDQTHALSGWATARLGPQSALTVSLAARSGWPTTPLRAIVGQDGFPREAGEPLGEARNSTRYEDYLRLDARLTHTWGLRRGVLRADAGVINLADRDNECCSDISIDLESADVEQQFEAWTGRAWTFSLEWRY